MKQSTIYQVTKIIGISRLTANEIAEKMDFKPQTVRKYLRILTTLNLVKESLPINLNNNLCKTYIVNLEA